MFHGVSFQAGSERETERRRSAQRSTARDAIVITPSNPFVSIDPILAVQGVAKRSAASRRPVVAVSPIVGGTAVKGPLAKMMRELGLEPSALGVARHYGSLVDGWIIDDVDRELGASYRSAWLPDPGLQYHYAHARRQASFGARYGRIGFRIVPRKQVE